jgi:phospholipid/cholesterol/gamma-HCH transport system substrate-binding protein
VKKAQVNKATMVGLLVAATLAAFVVSLSFFKKGGFTDSDSYLVYAYFSDATGLAWKSKVQIAGIQVGEVSAIDLEGTRARLSIRVKNEVEVRSDACLTKTYPSALLPDALLQLFPGTPDRKAMRESPVGEREITCVRESASIQQLMDSMANIATDVQKLTGDLATTVGGERGSMREIVENIAKLTRSVEDAVNANTGSLNAILRNAEAFTGDIREITHSEKERIKVIAGNVEDLTAQLKRVASSVERLLEGEEPGTGPAGAPGAPGAAGKPGAEVARAEARGIRKSIESMNDSVAKLNDLISKVQEGKSVAGKLLVDEKLGRQVGEAVSGATEYLDRMLKLQVEMNMRAEWLYNQSAAKSYFGVRLLPRPDKYYMLDIISDPRGVDSVKTESVTTQVIGGPDVTDVKTTATHTDDLTFSLQLAKRFGPVAFRVGIIESSGGLGMDVHLLDDTLQLSMSAYQFTRPQVNVLPRAKVWANYRFAKYFYVTGGADDFLNAWNSGRYPGGPSFSVGNDVFFGAGLSFTDDDIKVLLGSGVTGAIPKP